MTLDHALDILVRIHTEDDPVTGFRILVGVSPHDRHLGSADDYVEAWRVVREYNKFRTEPEHYPAST